MVFTSVRLRFKCVETRARFPLLHTCTMYGRRRGCSASDTHTHTHTYPVHTPTILFTYKTLTRTSPSHVRDNAFLKRGRTPAVIEYVCACACLRRRDCGQCSTSCSACYRTLTFSGANLCTWFCRFLRCCGWMPCADPSFKKNRKHATHAEWLFEYVDTRAEANVVKRGVIVVLWRQHQTADRWGVYCVLWWSILARHHKLITGWMHRCQPSITKEVHSSRIQFKADPSRSHVHLII